jgi:hypothetical protein
MIECTNLFNSLPLLNKITFSNFRFHNNNNHKIPYYFNLLYTNNNNINHIILHHPINLDESYIQSFYDYCNNVNIKFEIIP